MLYPILWLFASSFKGPSEIWTDVISLVPRRFSPQNYVTGWAGFGGVTFATFYKNSLIYAGVGTVTAVLSSAVVAYGFARIRFAGRGFWFTCMLLTLMLPYPGHHHPAVRVLHEAQPGEHLLSRSSCRASSGWPSSSS